MISSWRDWDWSEGIGICVKFKEGILPRYTWFKRSSHCDSDHQPIVHSFCGRWNCSSRQTADDILPVRKVYYSEKIVMVPVVALEGMCEVRRKQDFSSSNSTYVFGHNGSLKQLPLHIKLSTPKERLDDESSKRKKNGKCKEGKMDVDSCDKQEDSAPKKCLSTLDIFASCGGLSEGLRKAGASVTKWAIEYQEPAGQAFNLNHPEALMVIHNCNVILRAIMTACGDADDCVSTSEAAELVAKLEEKEINCLPRPGKVDFINGGPPCQGFSSVNRFNHSTWSKIQCEMILAFLSFAEYFCPKFFLLENVRNFVSFNKGQTYRLTLASLLEMGYQNKHCEYFNGRQKCRRNPTRIRKYVGVTLHTHDCNGGEDDGFYDPGGSPQTVSLEANTVDKYL